MRDLGSESGEDATRARSTNNTPSSVSKYVPKKICRKDYQKFAYWLREPEVKDQMQEALREAIREARGAGQAGDERELMILGHNWKQYPNMVLWYQPEEEPRNSHQYFNLKVDSDKYESGAFANLTLKVKAKLTVEILFTFNAAKSPKERNIYRAIYSDWHPQGYDFRLCNAANESTEPTLYFNIDGINHEAEMSAENEFEGMPELVAYESNSESETDETPPLEIGSTHIYCDNQNIGVRVLNAKETKEYEENREGTEPSEYLVGNHLVARAPAKQRRQRVRRRGLESQHSFMEQAIFHQGGHSEGGSSERDSVQSWKIQPKQSVRCTAKGSDHKHTRVNKDASPNSRRSVGHGHSIP